jgi:hypothetical protein
MRRTPSLALAAWLAVQTTSARVVAEGSSDEGEKATTSLRMRLGVNAARALTASSTVADRVRGLERLRTAGTPRAVVELSRAVSPGGTANSPEERLTAVRELAWFMADPAARRALAFVVGGHLSPTGAAPHPLDLLAEGTAAMALARAATPDALGTLAKALSGQGRAAEHARAALLAYPPRDIVHFLQSTTAPSVALATFLGELGDQRALGSLRDLVRRGLTPVRAAAAISLTQLGDYETVALARKWIAPGAPPLLRLAAARILTLARAAEAPGAIASLLESEETRADGLALADQAPSEALAPALTKVIGGVGAERVGGVLALLGRCGGAHALSFLERSLKDGMLQGHAAEALARMERPGAEPVLSRALSDPKTERVALRAAAARLFLWNRDLPGARAHVPGLLRSTEAPDRAAATQAAGLFDSGEIWQSSWSKDVIVRDAALALSFVAPESYVAGIAARLPGSSSVEAIALAFPVARRYAPTPALLELESRHDAAAPIAVLALAERDEARLRGLTDRFRESDEEAIRWHALTGLGGSYEPDSTGRLETAYRFESVPDVRAAIVRALSTRSPAPRTLMLAAALDPDSGTRNAARLALSGTRFREEVRGDGLVWIHPQLGAEEPASGGPTARWALVLPSGLALPVAPDPEGELLVPGVPRGSRAVRVAPEHEGDEAPGRGKLGSEKVGPSDRSGNPR